MQNNENNMGGMCFFEMVTKSIVKQLREMKQLNTLKTEWKTNGDTKRDDFNVCHLF